MEALIDLYAKDKRPEPSTLLHSLFTQQKQQARQQAFQ
jgi:hypothetical protein